MKLLQLFLTFLKIGAFTFGGGYAMLPLIQSEVAAHGWLTNEELVNFVAVSESTPGPFAVNVSTYVGMTVAGLPGAILATLGVTLPSFVIILLVAGCFEKFGSSKIVTGCLSGLKPAVVGLIAAALISVGITVFFPSGFSPEVFTGPAFWISLAVFAGSAVCAFRKIHPILIICGSAAVGILAGYVLGL